MTTIGVRELRQDASRWLREVEAGASVTVTSRGRPVARLVPIREEKGLDALRASGRLSTPTGDIRETLDRITPSRAEGEDLTQRLLDMRDDEAHR